MLLLLALLLFPLLLVALLRGFFRLATPWNRVALALPAALLFTSVPIAIANHRDDAPPVRLVHYLTKLYPPDARGHVALILSNRSRRHMEWYAPEFRTIRLPNISNADDVLKATKGAAAVYTDDEKFALPNGWYRLPVTRFDRSFVIYLKSCRLRLFLIDRGNSS